MTTSSTDVEPTRLSLEALATHVRQRLEDRVLGHLVANGQLTVTVEPAALPMAVHLCRDDPSLGFNFFDFLTAVDEREDGFAIVVHLYSTHHRHHIQLRALADGGRAAPTVPTISHLFAGANWHERETYDMFGVTFEGHPGLLPRILTVENFEGFPLRKDFLLMSREVKPWPGIKEPKEVADDEADAGGGGTTSTGPSAEDKARMAREKAERAKAKAAEARKRRAQERADAGEGAAAVAQTTGTAAPADTETPAGDGEVGAEKDAALDAGAGDDEIAHDPVEAAAVSDEAIAKDAAAGAVGGDTAAGASGDAPGADQPIEDDDREAELAAGGAATASGTPGVEAEGRHGGAEEQSGDRPADETPGMTPDDDDVTDEITPTFQGDEGGAGLPPRGPGDEEPRALSGDGVDAVPIAEEGDAVVSDTTADRPDPQRPIGTDADDRTRRLEEDEES